MRQRRRTKGFTLIELLVVIAIIGLLSSIVLASLNSARAKARDAKRASDLDSLRTALELYYSTNNSYPGPISYRSQCAGWNSLVSVPSDVIPGLIPTYLPQMPADPAMVIASNQNCYIYISNGTSYKILDYNIVDSPNPGSIPTLVDPVRNYGQPYTRPPNCPGAVEITRTWAIYSDSFPMCAW